MTTYLDGSSAGGTITPNAVLGRITVTPSFLHVLPDGTGQLTAQLLTAGGRPLVGDPDSWASSDEGVCTVDGDGLVTYVADGTAMITATKGVVDSDDVLVICGAVVGGPNEPAGMTTLFSHDFTEKFPDGWIDAAYLGNPYSVENDTSSPGSQPATPGAPNVGVFLTRAYVWQGTAVAGSTSSTIVLDSSASAVDDYYNYSLVSNDDQTGIPYRLVIDYVGATRTATITTWDVGDTSATWDTIPTNGSGTRMHGMAPGTGSCRIDTSPSPWMFAPTKFYFCGYFKTNDDFQACHDNEWIVSAGVNKCFAVNAQSNYYGQQDPTVHCPEWINTSPQPRSPDGPMHPHVVNVFARNGGVLDNTVLDQNENTSKELLRGTWYFVEGLIESSTVGNDDGRYSFWMQEVGVDPAPVRVIHFTNNRWETPVGHLTRWTFYNLQNVYGGGGVPIVSDNEYRHADHYVSGGYRDPDDEPIEWEIVSHDGTSVAAGSTINVTAQLKDGAGRAVNVFLPQPTFSLTNGATHTPDVYIPYTFETGLTTPPSAGAVRYNNDHIQLDPPGSQSPTVVYFSTHDRNGVDRSSLLSFLIQGATLLLTDEVTGRQNGFVVSSVTTGGSGATAYYAFTINNPTTTAPAWPASGDPGLLGSGHNIGLTFTCGQGINRQRITIPGGLTTGQTVAVTCEDYALINNGEQGRHRTSNTLTLTVL